MIAIAPLRTARLDVRLQELPIRHEVALCLSPDSQHEATMTEFLRYAIESAGTPTARHVADPRAWTVSERLLALGHYNVHAREDGPNWAVTDRSLYSDYLERDREPKATEQPTFKACQDTWLYQPLIGAMAEAIETLQSVELPAPIRFDLPVDEIPAARAAHEKATNAALALRREHWMYGLMAAQLLREGEDMPDPIADQSDYLDWLDKRIKVIGAFPGSDFMVLHREYLKCVDENRQYFRLSYDDEGVIVLPREGAGVMPAARFPVDTALTEVALRLTGKR